MNHPSGVAFDSSGNIWVCDSYNNRLEKFKSSGTYLAKYNLTNDCYDIHFDSSGNLWSANSYGPPYVSEYNSSTLAVELQFGTTGTGQFSSAQGLALGSQYAGEAG
jgi:tripartite motif-containing protein 71